MAIVGALVCESLGRIYHRSLEFWIWHLESEAHCIAICCFW